MSNKLSSILSALPGTKSVLNYLVTNIRRMPGPTEFRAIMEKRIEAMPEDERAEARRKLEATLQEFPTDAQLTAVIDDISQKLDPANLNAEELAEAGEYIQQELID